MRPVTEVLRDAETGISAYLATALKEGRIDHLGYELATANVMPALREWLSNPDIARISPQLQSALSDALQSGQWEAVVNAYRQSARFGTGGIRGMMAFDRPSIEKMFQVGVGAPILKGPNTINDIVLLLTSVGVAKFGKDQSPPFSRVVVGYDSRVRGEDFAHLVARLFLAFGYTVYVFDEPCPYPEVTFAIPSSDVKADVGIFISASHNDYRYNGYKLSCSNGSQFDPQERDQMYEKYIIKATPKDIDLADLITAPRERLIVLGGEKLEDDTKKKLGSDRIVINMHKLHAEHVKTFLMTADLAERQAASPDPLKIAYCAFHGAGRRAVPRLLQEVGFRDVQKITARGLNELNGLFPSFCSDPGREQQPDPGDPRAAATALSAFHEQYGDDAPYDILIGTDPDADRCGVVCHVPDEQREVYDGNDWTLIPADEMWALLVWYRLRREAEAAGLDRAPDADKKFIVLSHTTTDSIALLAQKHGIGVVKTWVGFASLAAAVRDVWDGKKLPKLVEGCEPSKPLLCDPNIYAHTGMDDSPRSINIAAMEQSNGFSILGGPPPDKRSLGVGGHVRDKDGTMAALLVAEVAAWAKEQGTTLIELVDKNIHLDPDVGLIITHYEPDPLDGEYPGIEGDQRKMAILRRALALMNLAQAGDLEVAGMRVVASAVFRTGKYDRIYPPSIDFAFPDEGIRLFLSEDRFSHVTIRPSGTGNSLRFHVQLRTQATEADLVEKKKALKQQAAAIVDDIRRLLKAPREL